nr:hypothetical protein [uncultured Kingella sp.]
MDFPFNQQGERLDGASGFCLAETHVACFRVFRLPMRVQPEKHVAGLLKGSLKSY